MNHNLTRPPHLSPSLLSPPHHLLTLLRHQRLNIPDHLRILIDTAITTEEPHACHTQNRLRHPLILVLVRLVHQRLRLNITVEVIRNEVVVAMVFNSSSEGREGARVAEGAALDGFEDFEEVGI